jgi:hypothetical protein
MGRNGSSEVKRGSEKFIAYSNTDAKIKAIFRWRNRKSTFIFFFEKLKFIIAITSNSA